jgi:ribosome maturation factor RimP
MRFSDLSDSLTTDIQDLLKSSGYVLVRAKKMGGERHPTLQIMMDRADGAPITVEDCEAVNRLLDPLFSVHDPWPEAYQLEVSSPGLDRPLILPEDFVRFVGQRVKVRVSPPLEGRRKFEGLLDSATTPQTIVIVLDDKTPWSVPYDILQEARIVITDEMIAEEMKKRGEG